jgi:DNA-binding transcriptional LysR family regulator
MELHVLLTSEILELVQAGDLDMAIVPGSRFDPSLAIESLGRVRFTWMAGANFEADDRALTPEDLRKYRIFSLGRKSYHNQTMQDWLFFDKGTIPRVDICNSMSIIALLTAAGLGISLLPDQVYRDAIDSGKLKPILTKPEIPLVEVSAVYPRIPPNTAQRCLAEIAAQVSTFEMSIHSS